jgi:hypothetical protein
MQKLGRSEAYARDCRPKRVVCRWRPNETLHKFLFNVFYAYFRPAYFCEKTCIQHINKNLFNNSLSITKYMIVVHIICLPGKPTVKQVLPQ